MPQKEGRPMGLYWLIVYSEYSALHHHQCPSIVLDRSNGLSIYERRLPVRCSNDDQADDVVQHARDPNSIVRTYSAVTNTTRQSKSLVYKPPPKTCNSERMRLVSTPQPDCLTADSKRSSAKMSRSRPALSTTTLDIAIDDDERWKLWFQDAFELLRQLACRDIAREWIRVIHPRKP
jgi:hypothetical protein